MRAAMIQAQRVHRDDLLTTPGTGIFHERLGRGEG
jgi:hypothetical protein